MGVISGALYRGGFSRGLLVADQDLDAFTDADRARVLATIVGSPDPTGRQVNGLGGGTSSTSKVVAVRASDDPQWDLEYRFHQVVVETGADDTTGTCGNLFAAAASFAVDEGIVPASPGPQKLRILDVNTSQTVVVTVPTENGVVTEQGDFSLPGIPGTSAPINVAFEHPAGRINGRAFPLEEMWSTFTVHGRTIDVAVIDAVNPVALVNLTTLGRNTSWTYDDLTRDTALLSLLGEVRRWCAVELGFARTVEDADSQAPQIPFVGLYADDAMDSGKLPDAATQPLYSCAVRLLSGGSVHGAVPLSAGLATAAFRALRVVEHHGDDAFPQSVAVDLAHASGILPVIIQLENAETVSSIELTVSARKIMRGDIFY